MRKHLSRVMAVLLVLAMALTMLPVVSAAKERFTATPIDGIPESGQTFVIYSAPAGGVFSPEASGPHIQAECFETSSEIHDEFVRTFGSACSAGPRHVSLVAAQRESLSRVGVDMRRVADAGICTVCCNDAYYSYRAQEGVCGRHGAFAFRAQ